MTKQDLKIQVAHIADNIMLQAVEYAKQQSIAFADFAIKEGFYSDNNEFGRWKNIKSKYNATWSTQDIHNQFIEQQNKP